MGGLKGINIGIISHYIIPYGCVSIIIYRPIVLLAYYYDDYQYHYLVFIISSIIRSLEVLLLLAVVVLLLLGVIILLQAYNNLGPNLAVFVDVFISIPLKLQTPVQSINIKTAVFSFSASLYCEYRVSRRRGPRVRCPAVTAAVRHVNRDKRAEEKICHRPILTLNLTLYIMQAY